MLQLIDVAHKSADFLSTKTDDATILVKVRPDAASNISPEKPKRKKKSRWKETLRLSLKETKFFQDSYGYFVKLGYRDAIVATIQAPAKYVTQKTRKDYCEQQRQNICKKIKRKGLPVIYLYTYEHQAGKTLHMHVIFMLPSGWGALIKSIQKKQTYPQSPEIKIETKYTTKNWNPKGSVQYATKDRVAGKQEYHEHNRKQLGPYRTGKLERIYGKRFGLSKDAERILEETGYYK